jgi:hypothetical protein
MGWWPTGNGKDIIGDEVADAVLSKFQFQEKMTGTKPTLQELLDATAFLVSRDGDDFLSEYTPDERLRLEAILKGPAPALQSRPEPPVDDLMFGLAALFRTIAGLYMNTGHERKPRLSELLAGLAFVLRSRPERVLRDGQGLELVGFARAQDFPGTS